jgi:hypothetical protein
MVRVTRNVLPVYGFTALPTVENLAGEIVFSNEAICTGV